MSWTALWFRNTRIVIFHTFVSFLVSLSQTCLEQSMYERLTFPLDAPKEKTGEFNLSRNVIWFNYIYWINFYHRLFLFHFHKFVINVRIKFRILPRFHFGNGTKVFIILIRHRVNRNKLRTILIYFLAPFIAIAINHEQPLNYSDSLKIRRGVRSRGVLKGMEHFFSGNQFCVSKYIELTVLLK